MLKNKKYSKTYLKTIGKGLDFRDTSFSIGFDWFHEIPPNIKTEINRIFLIQTIVEKNVTQNAHYLNEPLLGEAFDTLLCVIPRKRNVSVVRYLTVTCPLKIKTELLVWSPMRVCLRVCLCDYVRICRRVLFRKTCACLCTCVCPCLCACLFVSLCGGLQHRSRQGKQAPPSLLRFRE